MAFSLFMYNINPNHTEYFSYTAQVHLIIYIAMKRVSKAA